MATRRPPQGEHLDLFIACFSDIAFRDQRDMMERPFFSLSKTPRTKPIEYQVGNTWVRVEAARSFAMATIWDADVLIWAVSQIMEAHDRGDPTSPILNLHPYVLLKAIRREAGGREYKRLRAALDRLTGTLVRTNIRATRALDFQDAESGDTSSTTRKTAIFHWLEGWSEVLDETTQESRGITFTLPQWLYRGILDRGGVLTIHEDYFLLTGGLERWLYRVARKHAGHQECGWQFTMRQLYDKSGTTDRFANFSIAIRKIVAADKLPGYALELHRNDEGDEVLHLIPRERLLIDDPRYQPARPMRRRTGLGFYSRPLELPS